MVDCDNRYVKIDNLDGSYEKTFFFGGCYLLFQFRRKHLQKQGEIIMKVSLKRKKRSSFGTLVFVMLIFIITLAFVVYFKGMSKKSEIKERCTETTVGIVTNVKSHRSEKTRHTSSKNSKSKQAKYYEYIYYAEVTYTVNEKEYVCEIDEGTNKPSVGDKKEIHYDPDDPNINYEGFNTSQKNILSSVTGLAVILFIIICIIAYIVKNIKKAVTRKKRNQ